MLKILVMYPNPPGVNFDHNLYRDNHMPMVRQRMGDKLKRCTEDKGVTGGAPGRAPTYVAVGHLFCDSVEAFQAGSGPHTQEIMGDIPTYTNAKPVFQMNEVVVG